MPSCRSAAPPPPPSALATRERMRWEDMTASEPISHSPSALVNRGLRSTPDVEHRRAQFGERPAGDRGAHPRHQVDRPRHVVDRQQARRRRLADLQQVADVAAAVPCTHLTGTRRVEGFVEFDYEITLLTVRAFNADGQGTYADGIRAIDWLVANNKKYKIKILNLSFSAEPRSHYWDDPINQAVMKAWQKEIQLMLQNGFKLEVEALISKDISYVTEEYVPTRLSEQDFLD